MSNFSRIKLQICNFPFTQRRIYWMGSGGSSPEKMQAAEQFVQGKLEHRKVVVFSKSWCGFCGRAKSALAKFNLPEDVYEVIELDERDDESAIQDYLQKLTGARTVPRVFIGGKCVGGGDDVARLDAQGKLAGALQSAGALQPKF